MRKIASPGFRTIGRRQFLERAGAAAGGGLLVAGSPWSAWAAPGAGPKHGGRLRMAHPTDLANFDPYYVVEDNFFMQRALYDSLARHDEHMTPVPQVAEAWEAAKDGKSVRIKLRKGVLFHSGREVEAADIAFSISHVQDKKNGSQFLTLFNLIADVETPDKSTVVVRFRRPYPAMFDLLNLTFVLDKDAAADLKAKPAGSGPFVVESWQPGNQLILARNPRYWDAPRPYLDRVVQRVIPDPRSLVTSLQAGDTDLVWDFPLALYVPLQRDPRVKVDPGLIGNNYYDITLNVTREPFTNKLFRQAINYAIDREQFVKTVLFGTAPATSIPFPNYSIAYFKDLDTRYTYDLDKAKALIQQARLSGASFTALASAQVLPAFVSLAQILQASLKKIGINMTIENLESARYWERDHASDFQMLMHNFGRANLDPDTSLGTTVAWRPNGNIGKFSSPVYAQLVTEAGSVTDITQRKGLYRKIVEIILDECWDIPVAASPLPYAMTKKVEGFSYDRSGIPVLQNVWFNT